MPPLIASGVRVEMSPTPGMMAAPPPDTVPGVVCLPNGLTYPTCLQIQPTQTATVSGPPVAMASVPVSMPQQTMAPMTVAMPQQTMAPMTVAMPQASSNSMIPIYVDLPPQPLATPVTQQMELVWHGEFDRLFRALGYTWHLLPTTTPPCGIEMYLMPSELYMPSIPWNMFLDSAKVRFCCEECGHGWTSMKGRVCFWFYLDHVNSTGYVLFQLYGQQCKRCENGRFDHAMWYPEEVVKVIENIFNRVSQQYYGVRRPYLRTERRQGKPREQHNASLCQACKDGLCREQFMYT